MNYNFWWATMYWVVFAIIAVVCDRNGVNVMFPIIFGSIIFLATFSEFKEAVRWCCDTHPVRNLFLGTLVIGILIGVPWMLIVHGTPKLISELGITDHAAWLIITGAFIAAIPVMWRIFSTTCELPGELDEITAAARYLAVAAGVVFVGWFALVPNKFTSADIAGCIGSIGSGIERVFDSLTAPSQTPPATSPSHPNRIAARKRSGDTWRLKWWKDPDVGGDPGEPRSFSESGYTVAIKDGKLVVFHENESDLYTLVGEPKDNGYEGSWEWVKKHEGKTHTGPFYLKFIDNKSARGWTADRDNKYIAHLSISRI